VRLCNHLHKIQESLALQVAKDFLNLNTVTAEDVQEGAARAGMK
jgi:hypothetical protein